MHCVFGFLSCGLLLTPRNHRLFLPLQVRSQQNVQVNLTVAVPYEDQNNVSAIVDSAINSGQIRRGLQEAGLASHPSAFVPAWP